MLDLPDSVVHQIRTVLAAHPGVVRAAVFGSRALGRQRPESDIDLAVWGDLSDTALGRIHADLDDLPVAWLFDVVAYDRCRDVALRAHVDRCGVVVFERRDDVAVVGG